LSNGEIGHLAGLFLPVMFMVLNLLQTVGYYIWGILGEAIYQLDLTPPGLYFHHAGGE
jgi:hypothetical protein